MVFLVISLSIFLKSPSLKFTLIQALEISGGVAFSAALISYLLLKKYMLKNIKDYTLVERMFGYLQILSASSVAFAHGSNDVANAIGLVAAILHVTDTGSVVMQVPIPLWLLALGGVGIGVGICTFGYRVIETIGERITEITPSRGFSAEFAAATTVLVCSKLGLPISTSHTVVGSVIGVGFARGIAALDLSVIKNIIVSWLLTVPAAAIFTMLIYLALGFIF
jgi:PiT family inorganic phosphate transporter